MRRVQQRQQHRQEMQSVHTASEIHTLLHCYHVEYFLTEKLLTEVMDITHLQNAYVQTSKQKMQINIS